MNIEAQKVRLIERITQVEDQTILEQINAILEQDEVDFYDDLSDEQKASAQRGLNQVKSGETVSHTEIKKMYEKWL